MDSPFKKFKLAKFQALYKVGEKGLHLPPFKGATFRGTFGSVLREVACTCPVDGRNGVTRHFDHCVYAYLFETQTIGNDADVPRPFILEPPDQVKTIYAPGEMIWLGFTLFGKGIEYLPYFIYVLQAMGQKGFGKGSHPAELVQIFAIDLDGGLQPIYYHKDKVVKSEGNIYSGEAILSHTAFTFSQPPGELGTKPMIHLLNQAAIYFLSPTRLKYDGKYVDTPEFHIILRSAVRRITSLLQYHHSESRFEMDFPAFFEKAQQVRLLSSETEWLDWERYSNRQKERLKMGGIVGKAEYEGEIDSFLPWLKLAEWTNVGKNPVFGLGKIKVSVQK